MKIKIVETLDKAQELMDARKEQINLLDELVKSGFVNLVSESSFGNCFPKKDFIKTMPIFFIY